MLPMTKVTRPIPRPDPVSQGFWDATARGELAIQRCESCRTFQHPPRPLCRACGGIDLAFEKVSGEGRLWSWTVTYHNVLDGFAPALPYTCLLVELAEQKGLFLLSDTIGHAMDEDVLQVGLPMRAIFPESAAGEPVLPQFVHSHAVARP
jgi:uncharacterized OB-fold protein